MNFLSLPCRLMLAAAALCCATGCVTETLTPQTKIGEYNLKKKNFPPLSDYQLELRSIGNLTFTAGEPATLNFALRNTGIKPVRIDEWRMNEIDNLRLYCQPWLPGTDQPDPDAWVSLDEEIKQPELRYRLELMPDNQAIVSRKLNFIESLVVSSGAERRYFIRAELNLKSVRVDPVNIAIAVTPRKVTR